MWWCWESVGAPRSTRACAHMHPYGCFRVYLCAYVYPTAIGRYEPIIGPTTNQSHHLYPIDHMQLVEGSKMYK